MLDCCGTLSSVCITQERDVCEDGQDAQTTTCFFVLSDVGAHSYAFCPFLFLSICVVAELENVEFLFKLMFEVGTLHSFFNAVTMITISIRTEMQPELC
uniref:Uncharacterized protein n=1 Tax=Ditylenchus dipsaci TaxID=166011 RepID=A0A915DQY4_9BILA